MESALVRETGGTAFSSGSVTGSLKDDLAFLPTFCMRDIHFHVGIGVTPMALQMEWLKHLEKNLGGK